MQRAYYSSVCHEGTLALSYWLNEMDIKLMSVKAHVHEMTLLQSCPQN